MFGSKNYFIFILFVFIATQARADFTGQWCWDQNSRVSAFSIVINKVSGIYKGGYYSVAHNGNKIDDNETAFSFRATQKKVIKTKLKAGISGNMGLIRLEIFNNKIDWSVLKYPKGEIYVPQKAVLHRC